MRPASHSPCTFTRIVVATLGVASVTVIFAATAIPSHAFAEQRERDAESAYVYAGLASISEWERQLEDAADPLTGIDRRVIAESLLEELTRLWEVDVVPAAEQRIRTLLKNEGPLLTRYGFHPSGLLSANVTRLEVRNPNLKGYTIFLIRLENRSPRDMKSRSESYVSLVTLDGRTWQLQSLDSRHPLYPHLRRMQARFQIPRAVPAGSVATFQLIANRTAISEEDIAYFLLSFGDLRIVIKFYDNI